MKKIDWKKILPHIIAVAIFAIVAIIYCKPAFEGKVLQQEDTSQWKAMAQSSFKFKEAHGHLPLWTNSMFCGMPAYQIAMEADNMFNTEILNKIVTLNLPKPASFFFLACICFYFLACALRCNPYIAIATALSYAYCTYNPIIIVVGHETKMLAIAWLPALIGSLVLLFDKKYIWGTFLTAFTSTYLIGSNHLQITYYAVIIIVFMSLGFAIYCIAQKQIKHLLIVAGLAIAAALVGVGNSAMTLRTTSEYGKLSIRGGSILADANDKNSKTTKTGLNKDYAMSYSLYKTEPLAMMIPRAFGGGSGEIDETKSKAAEKLSEMQPQLAQQLQGFLQASYWGGIGATAGPPYIGAIICFLALIGFIVLDNRYKWWILACTIFTIMLSWGKYFDGFNTWMLAHLPAYDKFRAPSMILVVPTFLLTMLAALSLQHIINIENKEEAWKKYKKGLMVAGGMMLVALLVYLSSDFAGDADRNLLQQIADIKDQQQRDSLQGIIKGFVNALRDDRRALFMSDFFRSLAFMAVAAVMLWLFIKNKISGLIATIVIGVFAFIDVMVIDTKYLNSEKFVEADAYTDNNFKETPVITQLLKDKSQFRVFNVSRGQFAAFNEDAKTSYHLNSIGGYNPAKLSIYQDLIEKQLYNFPNCMPVVNMLNAKYIIQQTQQGEQVAIPNPDALGNCWFVKGVVYKDSAIQVMNTLTNLNTKDSAVVFANEKDLVKYDANTNDSTAKISLVKNENDFVEYTSNAASAKFAVFSEVYYNAGWKAYIDGKEAPIVKTNYVLRGLSIPAGNHKITFEFKPDTYYGSLKINVASSGLIWFLLIGAIVASILKNRKKEDSTS